MNIIETQAYGIFYKDGEKWRGPVNEFTEEEVLNDFECVDECLKTVARERKKKVKLVMKHHYLRKV